MSILLTLSLSLLLNGAQCVLFHTSVSWERSPRPSYLFHGHLWVEPCRLGVSDLRVSRGSGYTRG